MEYGELYNKLNIGQRMIFDKLVSGQNIFITGNAGTGKSFLVKAFDEFCVLNDKKIVKTAPTGVAAIEIGGATLHKQFGLKVGLDLEMNKITKQKIASNQKYEFLKCTDILLIDEISMVRIDIFDMLMTIIFRANEIRADKNLKPIQLIFVGDFYQLAPVISSKDNSKKILAEFYGKDIKDGFCFQSKYWRTFDVKMENLTEVIRQDDKDFCRALDECKEGNTNCIRFINSHSSKEEIDNAIWLCGKNATASEYNNRGLEELDSELFISKAKYIGDVSAKDNLCEDVFQFKIGARVVMTTNEKDGIYQNGSIGTIIDYDEEEEKITVRISKNDEVVEVFVQNYDKINYCLQEVENHYNMNGEKIPKQNWSLYSKSEYNVVYEKELTQEKKGTAKQYPMKLGYAVTIHKSQGQTYDAMNLAPEIFAIGQLYVALSRCKTVENIYIASPLTFRMVMCSEEVKNYYNDPEDYSFFGEGNSYVNMFVPKKYVNKIKEYISQLEEIDNQNNFGFNNIFNNGSPEPAGNEMTLLDYCFSP